MADARTIAHLRQHKLECFLGLISIIITSVVGPSLHDARKVMYSTSSTLTAHAQLTRKLLLAVNLHGLGLLPVGLLSVMYGERILDVIIAHFQLW
jgi:hypothetical protein